jgi:predicted urease superfamily metal-dependent hydrolase
MQPHEIEVTKEMIAHGMRVAHENAVPVQMHELVAIYQAMEAIRCNRARLDEGR